MKRNLMGFIKEKTGQGALIGLLTAIAVGSVAIVILTIIFATVLAVSDFSQNATFLSVQNDFMPLFAVALVGGSLIGAVLLGLGIVRV